MYMHLCALKQSDGLVPYLVQLLALIVVMLLFHCLLYIFRRHYVQEALNVYTVRKWRIKENAVIEDAIGSTSRQNATWSHKIHDTIHNGNISF